jgi:ABC-2 type transport system ATP-binding protein
MIKSDVAGRPAPGTDRDTVIEARGLTRYFGRRCAVNELTFRVPRGGVFAFIGRNGAGKTTTIRMLLGLLEPTRGVSTVLGYDSQHLPPEARARIGYMAEGHPVYAWMRVSDCARFQSGCYEHWNREIFAAVIDTFSIAPATRAGHLSHGQRAGLHLAMTLAIEPELLVLDDPATGLDPAARRSLLEAMLYFTRDHDRTIFFSSHLLEEVERVADRVAVLDFRVLRACCDVDTFRERVRQFVARFPAGVPAQLPPIPGLLRLIRSEDGVVLIVANPTDQFRRSLRASGAATVDDLPISLEDALTAYVGRQGDKSFFLNTLGDASCYR